MARSSTTFRPKWKIGNTTVIRVPEKLAPEVLRYAHDLDEKWEASEMHEPKVATVRRNRPTAHGRKAHEQ